MNPSESNSDRRARVGRPPIGKLLGLFLGLCIVTAVAFAGIFWWQERPLRVADDYLDAGDGLAALETIDAFLESNPLHGGALSLRARALVAVGHHRQAVQLFEQVGGTTPREIHAWSQALLKLERWRTALPMLEYLTGTDVDQADVLHELAACRAKVGNFDGAIQAATQFSGLPDCSARGNLLLGTLHNDRGNLRQAAAAWSDVLKEVPDAEGLQIPPEEFFLEYGRVLHYSGDSKLAVEMVRRSLALQPKQTAYVVLGDASASLGDADAARDAYRKALELDGSTKAARVGLAQLALTDGDPDAAEEWLGPVTSRNELTSEIAFLLQQTAMRRGDREAAENWRSTADALRRSEQRRETAMQVLRDVPESNWAQVLRAYKFAEAGNWGEAELILRPIVESAKDQPFIQQLYEAVRNKSEELPSLELLPLNTQQ